MKTLRKLLTAIYWIALTFALSTCSEPEQPKPNITSISPGHGTVGTQVTISGKNFASVQSVLFGSTASFIVTKTDTQIVTVVPPGAALGDIQVIVKTDGGTSNSIPFTVILSEPEITAIEPDKGSSGMEVIVKGKHLETASKVTFGATDVTTFLSKTDTEITLTIPADLELGALDVTVTAGGGTSAKATFTVVGAPTINSFSPTVGAVGKKVAISGTNFEEASEVLFGGVSATFQFLNAALVEATVPVGAVTDKIKVITPGGEAVSTDNFIVKEAPIIGEFSPTMGVVGTQITINGINFDSDVTVKFGDVEATDVTIVSPTELTVKIPDGAVTGPLTLDAPAGSSTSEAIFTVIGFPTITSFTPDRGGVGTSVVIKGENFINVEEVRFNDTKVLAANYQVISATMVTATVPAGSSTGRISVKTPSATVASTALFTVLPPPTITSFTPALGPPGRKVSITGTNFSETTNVFVGAKEAAFEVKSATLIEITVPVNAQTGKVKVVTLGGQATSATEFVVKDGPEITSFTPSSGIVGTVVTINGKNFDAGAIVVKFGNGTANSITVASATQLTTVVPASATTGKITVETAAGSMLSAANFTVIGAPTVSLFAPSSGPIGTEVVITGSNFVNVSGVKFNGTDVLPANYTIVSNTKINAKVPADAVSGKISVTTPAGTGVSGSNFTVYPPPTVASFTPAIGPAGTIITITGTSFAGTTQVFVGTTEAAFSVNSATELEVTIPAGAVTGKIKVITPGGQAISTQDFVVKDPPQITSFSPASGIVGSVVAINGSNFDAGGVSVKFGTGTAITFTVVNASQITATVPADATTGKITVTTSVGSVLSASNFTVIGLPTITSFLPGSGGVGTDVTITGTNFINVSAVKFNNTTVAVGNFTVVSATQINMKVPAGATTGKIWVTTPAGTAVSAGDFTVLLPPTITSFNPTSGPTGGSVVITGTEFSSVTAISFNEVNAGSFTINSSTQITASVPANGTTGKIKVTNAAGTATSAATFYVTPYITSLNPTVGSIGTPVTITGINLGGATVFFGATSATPVTNTNTSIIVLVPSIGNGSTNVTVANLGGTSNSQSFMVTEPVILSEIVATANIKGQLILLSGSNLSGATKVLFGTVEASINTNTAKVITAIIPTSLSAGTYQVKAVTATGTSNGLAFEVLSAQGPDTGGITLGNDLTVVSIPPGYVPPVSNQWSNTLNTNEKFLIAGTDGDPTGTFGISLSIDPDFETIQSGSGVYDFPNNYVEFTLGGIRYVGVYTPPTGIFPVCYAHMTLISTESGRQIEIFVQDYENCPE